MTEDDPYQSRLAQNELAQAELVAVTLPALCEMVWVRARGYKIAASDIAAQIRILLACETIAIDRPAVESGLALLDGGGDFADGVIACEGTSLGADEFVSFDKRAVTLLQAQGKNARLLA